MAILLAPTEREMAEAPTAIEWARETLSRIGAQPLLARLDAAVGASPVGAVQAPGGAADAAGGAADAAGGAADAAGGAADAAVPATQPPVVATS